MALTDKLKIALDETRLLVLGSQILFGFQLNAMFQDGFEELSTLARGLNVCGFFLMAGTVGLLTAPSMQHRIVERGYDSRRLHGAATRFAELALLPFAVSLGLTFYLVLERHAGVALAAGGGALFFALAILFWFGIARMIERPEEPMDDADDEGNTPLHTRIDQMLTEARVILPGAQAMLGFQFAVMLTKTFDRLPQDAKLVHVAALSLVAVAVILLMTPAAIHRLTFRGEDDERFLRIGSGFLIAAAAPLGLGISLDMFVAIVRVTDSPGLGSAGACLTAVLFTVLWFVQPLMLRSRTA
jgi:Family of unknown function (DUF6328)